MFYISTRGSTASTWIAKVLSKHPQIICFRATRSFPPEEPYLSFPIINSWIKQMPPERFMEGLSICSQATLNEKIFGSIHGYHGMAAKDACENRGGNFVYIIRHPLARIHSVLIYDLYNFYYKKYNINIKNEEIHNRINSLFSDQDIFLRYKELATQKKKINSHLYQLTKYGIKNILPQSAYNFLLPVKQKYLLWKKSRKNSNFIPDEKVFIISHFNKILNDFFRYDNELFFNCSNDYGVKMEDIVKSKKSFKNDLLKKIVPELNISSSYLEAVVTEPRFNIHRKNALSAKEIWNSWPIGMKKMFLEYFEKYEMLKICNGFNYDISFIDI